MKKIFALLALFVPLTASAGSGCEVITVGSTSCVPLLKAIASSDHFSEKTDSSGWTCKRSKNGGATASCSGTIAELSDSDSPGTLTYAFNSADVDTAGSLHFHITATGMDPIDYVSQVGLTADLITAASMADVAESTAVPGVGTIDPLTLLRVVYQKLVSKWQSTTTEATWYRGDGTTVWTTQDISDAAGTSTRTADEADD